MASYDPVLTDLLVVSLEQAVAAPYCSRLLADAGARVIKLERPEGDFARAYDQVMAGESAYFVWLNVGKESIAVDLRRPEDRDLVRRMLGRADVFLQNLRAGAVERLGLGWEDVRALNPGLVMCSITGFGAEGPDAGRKAYDALVQAESGICAITGPPGQPSKVGISICDISSGLTAFGEILKALIARRETGTGRHVECSLFGTMAEWMTVPWAYTTHAGKSVTGRGMDHGQIAPYGDFQAQDGPVFLVVQNDREWRSLCDNVLEEPELARDPRFATNPARVENLGPLKDRVNATLGRMTRDEAMSRLEAAGIACGAINDVRGFADHAALQVKGIDVNGKALSVPARVGDARSRPQSPPVLDEHGTAIRAEFC